MTTAANGHRTEIAAAVFLEQSGFRIIDRNYRTRWSGINLVARDRSGTLHIIEVKYRAKSDLGSGFDYITSAKQARLRRAAAAVASQERADQFQIDVIQVAGSLEAPHIDFLENAVEG